MHLLDNGRIYRFDSQTCRFVRHRSILIDNGTIVALDAEPTGIGVERRDLDGATVVPAFSDCHVHLAQTGYYAGPRSLARVRSYREYEEAIAAVPTDGEMLYAGQYDDALWTDGQTANAAPLERHHPDALAMITRVDGHSCVVNQRTLAWLKLDRNLDGIERDEDCAPTGRLFLDANWTAHARFTQRIPLEVQRAGERRACDLALSRGITHIHPQLLGRDRDGYTADIEFLRTLPIDVHPKICEPDASFAADHGLPYIGGDVFLDGSIGSCTAAFSHPYLGERGSGQLRFTDEQLEAYVGGAEERGISAGVHAIGDAAIDQFIRVTRRVLGGKPSPRGTHHFIEHFEMPQKEHIEACIQMSLHASMQPQFHATWGNEGGMYDQRLGAARRRSMNPLRTLAHTKVNVAGGSDAPVCELDALAGMHAACNNQEPEFCLDPHEALALYTVNASIFARTESQTGNLTPGLRSDVVILDHDPLTGTPFNECSVIETARADPVSP